MISPAMSLARAIPDHPWVDAVNGAAVPFATTEQWPRPTFVAASKDFDDADMIRPNASSRRRPGSSFTGGRLDSGLCG